MPNLKELRGRLRSIRATKQITHAMQLVAASKLKRAEERSRQGRAFEQKIVQLLGKLPADVKKIHSWYQPAGNQQRSLAILFTSDRGLAGSLNINVIRELIRYSKTRTSVSTIVVGRRGQEAVARLGYSLVAAYPLPGSRPLVRDISALASLVIDQFQTGEYDNVVIIGNRFRSVMTQVVETETVLPVPLTTQAEHSASVFSFDTPSEQFVDRLLKEYVRARLFQLLLESMASEQAARMLAMQNATDNAESILEDIELTYHGLRKSKITAELAEIVSGAESLI